ncbi:MAG: deoxyribose-phosphate aldolase [Kiritimatiellia bacterium]|nr:deoxyribose-phosphate aldolase [Kiritimatiellia bacterium]
MISSGERFKRNPGTRFDARALRYLPANLSAIERRAATLGKRRSVKQEWQIAWLLKAVTLIDLTTLSGDDTPGRVERLCAKAKHPVRRDLLEGLGVADLNLTTGAVCVYHKMVPTAVDQLKGTRIPVAAVSTGFPAGMTPLAQRIEEIHASVEAGAAEIDIVISRDLALTGNWRAIYQEVKEFRKACGRAHLKAILATGHLATMRTVAKASMVCMMAGADFIKTSTGKEPVNATLPVGLVMARAIRNYQEQTGHIVGFKPAGGISKARDVLPWLALMKEELGDRWLQPDLFRIGASSLLADIERQVEFHLTGRYSAYHRHPMG